MRKKGNRIRLFAAMLALSLAATSAAVPSATAQAAKKVKVKKVQITKPQKKSVTLNKGKSLQLKVKVTPKNAKNKKVTYKSSNKKIVKVTSKGKITGVKNGSATIKVTAKDGSKKKATLKVKVVTPVSKVKLNMSSATIKVGENKTLKATITPSTASNKKLTWKSSDKKIVSVTSKGVVKGVKAGKATVTATAADGSKKKASCIVTVKNISNTNNPNNPDDPNKPENPDDPNKPDNPDDPNKPDNPDDPNKPDNPDDPNKPDNPDDPNKPENPDDPNKPDNPDDPNKPVIVTLKKIEVTKSPDKITYQEGDVFEPAGMEVTATYSDGTQKKITEYTYYNEPLGPLDQSVEVRYTEKGITRKTEVGIMVQAEDQLVSISCRLKKTSLEREGSCFTDDDIVVTATFQSGKIENVPIADCKVNPQSFTLATTSATVSYTYGVRRRSVVVEGFTVKPYRERYTFEDADTMGTLVKRANENAHAVPTEEHAQGIEPKFEQGLSGNALKMDGTYGLRLDKIAGTASKSYSVSMWVKPDSLKNNQALLISTANKFGLQDGLPETWCAVAGSNETGGIKLWSNNNGHVTATQSQISVGANAQWSHIVLVVDGRNMPQGTGLGTLYVNGRRAGSGNVRNDKSADMKTYLGVTGWTGDGYYAGLVDELVFTNEVLTQEEVEEYYLEYFAKSAEKITDVTADKTEISIDYGTTAADLVKTLKEQITFTGQSGENQLSLDNTEDIWTVEDYKPTTEGTVTAVAKIPVPEGYVFETDGQPSMWKTVNVSVSVKEKGVLESIKITTQPDKTKYIINHTFDKSGMVVKALYSNGGQLDVTEHIVVDETGKLSTLGEQNVEVNYVDGEGAQAQTFKTTCPIEVVNLEEGATAYFTFDDNLTNASTGKDAVKAKLNNSAGDTDTTSYVEGVKGSALKLGKLTGEGIKLDNTINTANYSISMWVRADNLDQIAGVFYAKDGAYEEPWFSCYGDPDLFNIRMVPGDWNQKAEFDNMEDVLEIGKWKMLTLTAEGESAKFYVDGALKAEKNMKNMYQGKSPALYLGITPFDMTFLGAYDELSIYDFALSPEEVRDLYERVSPTIAGISLNKTELTFLKEDATAANIQKALKALKFHLSMKNGAAPDYSEVLEEDWQLPETLEGTFTVTKELTIPAGYVLADGVDSTLSVDITVKDAALDSLQVAAMPEKLVYVAGEKFDKTGMVIMAKYSDNSQVDVTQLIQIANEEKALTKEDAFITVKYTEGGVEKSKEVAITVKTGEEIVNEISPARTAYYQFDGALEDTVSAQGASIVKNQPVKAGADDVVADAAPEYVDGISGKAIHFSGNGTHNGLKLNTAITSANYTVSMWVKPETQVAEFAGAFYAWKDDKNYISWYSQFDNGFVGMAINDRKDTGQVANMFKTDEWKMVTWVMNGDTGKVYLNGELVETATQHANFFTANTNTTIYLGSGCFWDNSFNGAWDEVSLFNDALTDQQIKGLYMSVANPTQ